MALLSTCTKRINLRCNLVLETIVMSSLRLNSDKYRIGFTLDPAFNIAGTFLTARNCIQAHQLFPEAAAAAADEDESTLGLRRTRWERQPTGDANKEEAKDEAERLFGDPEAENKYIIHYLSQ